MAGNMMVWKRDDARCEKVLLTGGDAEVCESGFGANDFVIAALMELGLWDAMVRMYPNRLKQQNGYDWRILNGVAVLRELMKIRTICGTNKVLSDPRLVAAAGFNLADVSDKLEAGEPVMDSETLANHLGRIDEESCYYTVFEFVKWLRRHGWMRGKVFAADGKWITVKYGRDYKGMGTVRDSHGYKMETLFNVHNGRELFAGFIVDSLQRDERDMLLELFQRYEEHVAPIRETIDILLLDRGYWGAKFFKQLVEDYGVDLVSRPRDKQLSIVGQIMRLVELDEKRPARARELRWQWRTERRPPNKEHPKGEVRRLRLTGIDGLRIEDEDGTTLDVNAVVVYEHDAHGRPLDDPDNPGSQLITIYITTLPAAKNPMRIRKLYCQRWPVENQGFREVNQNWDIERVVSRVSFDAVCAALAFKVMVYDCERVLRMKYPKDWTEEKTKLKKLGSDGLIGGAAIVVYLPDGYLGVFSASRFRKAVAAGSRKVERRLLKEALIKALRDGRDGRAVQDIIREMDDT